MVRVSEKKKKETVITNEYICDDRPIEMSEEIANMTDEEIEKEFIKRFKESEYQRICVKLGFVPSEYVAPKTDTENDNWNNPFLVLTSEEIDFLYLNGYLK